MNKHQRLLTGLGAVAILASSAATLPSAFAATTATGAPMSTIVEKIASKFNLNKDEVQAVFDEERTARKSEMQAQMKTKAEERLSAAVTSGELTEAQKTAILAKLDETHTKMEAARAIEDPEDRQAAITQLKADLAKWAAENNISNRWLMPHGMRGKGQKMHGMREGMNREVAPSTTTTLSN